jgi:hypothetical protein
MRDCLIEQGKRVANGAFRGACDQRKRGGLNRDRFLGRNSGKMLNQRLSLNPA